VEWIEVSARTLEDATELALDRLGVVSDELEYEVIDEPRGGLFGIGRTEARIRARVKPLSREKPADRRRRRPSERRPSGGRKRGQGGGSRSQSEPKPAAEPRGDSEPRGDGEAAGSAGTRSATSSGSRRRRGGRGRGGGGRPTGSNGADDQKRAEGRGEQAEATVNVDAEDIDVDGQAERAEQFMTGLIEAMGLDGRVSSRIDEGTILLSVEGDGLGLLVGPRGSTLQAVEELARAVVQHGLSGRSARLRVDIGGYRERRREALAAFARQVADEVRASGTERALEPMSPPDRKVVHDTVSELDGVDTSSEGEEPRRRVVIHPA
jgi:spoIIIJ-associated protein